MVLATAAPPLLRGLRMTGQGGESHGNSKVPAAAQPHADLYQVEPQQKMVVSENGVPAK